MTCLLVADAARARIYTYDRAVAPDGHEELKEVLDLVDEARLQRESALFSDDSGAGRNGVHSYGLDDHRQHHIAQLDAEFAAMLAGHVSTIAHDGGHKTLLLVASSRMLGALRPAIEPLRRFLEITELERDFTKLTTPQLREHLAELHLLPAAPRLAFAAR